MMKRISEGLGLEGIRISYNPFLSIIQYNMDRRPVGERAVSLS
jgi:hypothetical protein